MSDTNSISTAQEAPAQTIAERIAVPFALFSGALFVLLSVSYFFLLPRFTNLHLSDGTQLSPRKITQYQLKLTADLQSQEETRVRLVLPVLAGRPLAHGPPAASALVRVSRATA